LIEALRPFADCTDAVLASPMLSRTKTVIDFGRYWAYGARDRSAEARHSGSAYNLPTGTHPGVGDCRPEAPSAKGTSYAHRNGNVKPLRVLVMAAQQDTKKLDLVSYTLVFLIVVVAAEAILAVLIWWQQLMARQTASYPKSQLLSIGD
jgi:hypothetical protein